MSDNRVIGQNNKLPWHIPEDLQFFKQKTLNKVVIMGRKTFESLGRPLPKRLNIVITRQANYKVPDNVFVCPSLESVWPLCSGMDLTDYGQELFIIGGGEVYKQSLNHVQFIYLTHIHQRYEGDAFYPPIPKEQFKEIQRRDCAGDPAYSFITYERMNPRHSCKSRNPPSFKG